MAKIRNWLKLEKEDLDKRIRSYPKFRASILLAAILGFLVSLTWLGERSLSIRVRALDQNIAELIARLKTPFLVKLFSWITVLGADYFIISLFFILAIILVIKNRKRAAAVALFSLAGSALVGIIFRNFLFFRLRPSGCITTIFMIDSCASFPSGHTTWAFYFYGLLNYLIFRFLPIPVKKFLIISFIIASLVTLIALSRLFLGVHYPSDIIGGFFLGGAWLFIAILLIDILY